MFNHKKRVQVSFGKVPEGTQRVVNTFGSEVKFSKLQGFFLPGQFSPGQTLVDCLDSS